MFALSILLDTWWVLSVTGSFSELLFHPWFLLTDNICSLFPGCPLFEYSIAWSGPLVVSLFFPFQFSFPFFSFLSKYFNFILKLFYRVFILCFYFSGVFQNTFYCSLTISFYNILVLFHEREILFYVSDDGNNFWSMFSFSCIISISLHCFSAC